ncbi:MAG: RluA family pseudouridine synthase [Clostridia bacterium]|nr:RluA family pseudouridine synthase [Clostridia bacterium]
MAEEIRAGRFRIEVLYEDNHLLVVVKPPNLPAQADSSGDDDLLSILKRYIGNKYQKPGNVYLGLVHRLDRPVGGVMVFARTSKAAARLSAAFAQHAQDRRYLAVVQGSMPACAILEDALIKDGATGTVRVVPPDTPGAKPARLRTAPLARREGLTLTEVTLYTGRSHQIRVQHAHAGYPLWGDARYGGGRPGQQIALWAALLRFEHPTRHEALCFTAPPPGKGAWLVFAAEANAWMKGVEP